MTNWLDIIAVALLSIATLASSWCSYQAELWSGVQADKYTAAGGLNVEAALASGRGGQLTIVDTGLFTNWLNAYSEGRADIAAFHERRFRPEFAPAFRAWVATHPLRNREAPAGPFVLKEYRVAEMEHAEALSRAAFDRFEQGRRANERGDAYVRLTVVLGAVLFLAGISQPLRMPVLRSVLLGVAGVLLLFALYRIATSPLA